MVSSMNDPSASRHRGATRRDLLRGSGGALLALPWLESWSVRVARAEGVEVAAPPVRFCVLYQPNGVHPGEWAVRGEGADFEWSSTLAPLAPLREQVTVISGLWHRAAEGGDGHYVKTGAFLTGTTIKKTTGRDLDAGNISADQVVAQSVGREDLLPSLELSAEPVTAGIDRNVSTTRLYGSYLSWSDRLTPCAREIDPQGAFDRVFRPGAPNAAGAGASSVLDTVRADAKSMLAHLGAEDRKKLEEYLESVRTLERRIESEAMAREHLDALSDDRKSAIEELAERLRASAEDPERAKLHATRVSLLLEVAALALATRVTRVATIMLGNAVTNQNFSFLEGVSGGFHEYSHHENKPEKLEPYARINRWHVERFAEFASRLAGFREGDGSVLDHSLVLFGAGFRDGNAHDPHDLPLVLAGRGGDSVAGERVAGGRHLAAPRDTPMANLLLALMRRAGVDRDRFADSTAELPLT